MLNQMDIDFLMKEIMTAGEATIYYVAHMIEPREGVLDEHEYKSASKFKVLELKVTNIWNAYWEYMHFINNPGDYHTESSVSYYDHLCRHTDLYVVPNDKPTDSTDSRVYYSRIPSIIYGLRKQIVDNGVIKEYFELSPIKPVYTNTLDFYNYGNAGALTLFNGGNLGWKYRKVDPPIESDGVEYSYVTSDWYILQITNFPKIELPLINVKQKSSFFRNLNSALDYIDQLEA